MKLKQLITNKKNVIVLLAILLALIVAIVILVTPGFNGTGDESGNSKTEQSNDHAITENSEGKTDQKGEGEHQGDGLEVLKPNEAVPENSSEASGDWEEQEEGKNETNDSSDGDKQEESKQPEREEAILDDDITWGNIY